MDIETKKSFNKLKHYLTLFNNAYFDKNHMWILCGIPTRLMLYRINDKTILGMDYLTDYLQWI